MSAIHLKEEDFDKTVLHNPLPVLVDFWATWCGPCRMLAPVIEELSDEFDGVAEVCKLDVDDAGDTAAAYEVMSIPTVIIFKNGKEHKRLVGYRAKEEFAAALRAAL